MMNTAFKLTRASLVLAFTLASVAAKVIWVLLGIIFDASDSIDGAGYRHEVNWDDAATHTHDGRRIVD